MVVASGGEAAVPVASPWRPTGQRNGAMITYSTFRNTANTVGDRGGWSSSSVQIAHSSPAAVVTQLPVPASYRHEESDIGDGVDPIPPSIVARIERRFSDVRCPD